MTDVKLVARVTAVEETIGDIQNGINAFLWILIIWIIHNNLIITAQGLISDTIAFHTVLTIYDTIPDESVVLFDEVLLNEGDG